MLKRASTLLAMLASLMAFVVQPVLAAGNYEGNAVYAKDYTADSSTICWAVKRLCITFGGANTYNTASQCSTEGMQAQLVSEFVPRYGIQAFRRINDNGNGAIGIGGIGGVASLLKRDTTGAVYATFLDCGVKLGGKLQGLLCIDLEEASVDRQLVFEGCYYVAETKRVSV